MFYRFQTTVAGQPSMNIPLIDATGELFAVSSYL